MNGYMDQMDRDHAAMVEKDRAAKAAGTLVGRYFTESYADSQAYYEIVKVSPRTCTLPIAAGPHTFPLSSTIRTSTPGSGLPTVPPPTCMGSVSSAW